ncbi:MAG TPA: hypothetical protein VNK23_12145 [Candidatus Dormibacteraeota bacterium]|nr:hypothetical protein [Candidatus Dormibacteraeota bacterium]
MALVSLSKIREMLDKCASGHNMELKTHAWHIYYNGLTYPALPKYDEIEEFHVRKLARTLQITPCAKKFFGY